MPMKSVNPATGAVIEEFETLSNEQIEKKIAGAERAFDSWKRLSYEERATHLLNVADHLEENVEKYAKLLTTEMGKLIGEARSEVEKCAWNFRHYAEKGTEYLADRPVETDAEESYVTYEPLGVILNVMPWNFAFWQALRMAAPILMAGNTILLKHASNVPQASLALEEIFVTSGCPDHIYQSLLIGSSKIADLIGDDRVRGVALTGSEGAGRAVGELAGKNLKPVILELGGSDPSIVLPDADLSFACTNAVKSRLLNNGQSCIGSKRFIVHESIYDDFLEKLTEIFASQVIGDPMSEETTLGPVVSEDALQTLIEQIEENRKAGATVHYGGKRSDVASGFYLEPTILTDVTSEMPAYNDELFGPVVVLYKYAEIEEAIEIANATDFGLGASIYTGDPEKGRDLAERIEAGSVFINSIVKSDPRLPFGGIKNSGVGRELSQEGARAFTNVKTVWVDEPTEQS